MSDRQTGAKVFLFFLVFRSTTIICLKPNGIVSLLVAAAFAMLALTEMKIPEDITRKRIFFFSTTKWWLASLQKKNERQ